MLPCERLECALEERSVVERADRHRDERRRGGVGLGDGRVVHRVTEVRAAGAGTIARLW